MVLQSRGSGGPDAGKLLQSGSRSVSCWDRTGPRPPTWAQACLVPTENQRGGFQNHQQRLACFLTGADTETTLQDFQDTRASQRGMSGLMHLILGLVFLGRHWDRDLGELGGGRGGLSSGGILSLLSRIFKNSKSCFLFPPSLLRSV